MYYTEEVINGVLCFKNMPDAEWQEFTKQQLTDRLIKAETDRDSYWNKIMQHK